MKERHVIHVDVNSAYLSWESSYRLQTGDGDIDLRTVPSVVGGDPKTRRGIVLAKSEPARRAGIKTGETLHSAFRKCPQLTVVKPRYELYIKASQSMVDMLKEYSPCVERFSIDECFLDVTHVARKGMTPEDRRTGEIAGMEIKDRIKRELGFTVSVGVSSCKLLAKVASDIKKPDGLTTLYPDEISTKMWPLPVEDLFMVGRATARKLHAMGIYTIGELSSLDRDYMTARFGKHGSLIWDYSRGMESSEVIVPEDHSFSPKGMGNSTTLPFDACTRDEALPYMLSLSEMVGARLRGEGLRCTLVSVSIKTDEFVSYSRQKTLGYSTDSTSSIFSEAAALFDEAWRKEPIRHIGLSVSGLAADCDVQLSLFSPICEDRAESLDRTIDSIRRRFGNSSVMRASLLHTGVKHMTGGTFDEDFPGMKSSL